MKIINEIYIDNVYLNKQYHIHKILGFIWLNKASDMIFVPLKQGVKIKLKKGSKTIYLSQDYYDYSIYKQVVNAIILGTNLNPCTIEPQNSSFSFVINNQKLNIRVSIQSSTYDNTMCLRLIENSYFNLESFNISQELLDEICNSKGITFIAGRTCSGKTSFLYSILSHCNQHVVTIEDPIESVIDNIIQTDVTNIGYENGCKAVLRQNPDIIVIGEVRDKISAQSAIRCALTGHCVLTTIHINNENEIINRLGELGCKYFDNIINKVIYLENFQYKVHSLQNNTFTHGE